LFLKLFVLYLLVLLMVLLFSVIYVCVTERSRKNEMENGPILYFEKKTTWIDYYQLRLFCNRIKETKELLIFWWIHMKSITIWKSFFFRVFFSFSNSTHYKSMF
jgi:hypothetical protein